MAEPTKADIIIDLLNELVDIVEDKSHFYISYPLGGGTVELQIGRSIFDFYNGVLIHPDGTRTKLPSTLKGTGRDVVRAVSVGTDAQISIGSDSVTGEIDSGQSLRVNLREQQLRVLYITTTEATNITVWASSAPDGIINLNAIANIEPKPTEVVVGSKTNISSVAAKLTSADTPIKKAITVKCRSLGTGSYIALGDSSSREFRFLAVGDWHEIDYINNLNKIYVNTDAGNTGELEWIGG